MNLQTLKPSYTTLPKEERLRMLEKIRTNRFYPTGRMCNYLSWKQLPAILKGVDLEQASETESNPLDSAKSPSEPCPGLLPSAPGTESPPASGSDDLQ